MNCRLAEKYWLLERYGEAGETESRRLAGHLAGCGRCRRRVAELEALWRKLEPGAAGPADPDWAAGWSAIEKALAARSRPAAARPLRPSSLRLRPRLAAVGALLAALFFAVGIWVGRQSGRRPPAAVGQTGPLFSEAAAVRHFAEVRTLVTDLGNAAPGDEAWSAPEPGYLDDLLWRTRLLRSSSRRAGRSDLADLLGDVELILIESRRLAGRTDGELTELQRLIGDRQVKLRLMLYRSGTKNMRT